MATSLSFVTSHAFAVDDVRRLEQQAEAQFQRAQWSDAEASYLELLAAIESTDKVSLEMNRLRLRCWYQLEQLARQAGRPEEALRFALRTREAIARLPDAEIRLANLLHIAEYRVALSDDSEARATLQDLLAGRSGAFKTLPRLKAAYLLGVVDLRANQLEAANANFVVVEKELSKLLDQHRKSSFLPAADWLDLMQQRIAILEALPRADDAKFVLEELIAKVAGPTENRTDKSAAANRNDSPLFQAFLGLARHARLRRDTKAATQHLRNALSLTQQISARQRASAFRLLAMILEDHDPRLAREAWIDVTLKLAPRGGEAIDRKTSVGDLQSLIEGYSRADRLTEAIQIAERLVAREEERHGLQHRLTIAATTTLGELLARDGQLLRASELLERVLVADRQDDAPRKLVRVLMQLAAVRRAVGDLTTAESLLREAIDVTDKRMTADDPEHSLAKQQLAALLPSVGRFREAIALNQQLLDEAAKRGARADRLRAEILLNLAVIHQNQGLTESAAEYAANAARVTESVFGKEAWQLAGAHNVLAAISRDLGFPDQAKSNAETAIKLCQQHRRGQQSEAATAHQLLGSLAARRGDVSSAIGHWRSAANVFHARGQAAREAQLLSLIGGLALQTDDQTLAASALDQAETLLHERATSPLDCYVTWANQALRRSREGDLTEAIRLLQQAVNVAESARTETAGDAEAGRAKFFSQFAPAFERLVEWQLAAKQPEAAFRTAEQSRSRTQLDQLQLAGIDLKGTLTVESQQRLLPQERRLAQEQVRLRNQLADAIARQTRRGREAGELAGEAMPSEATSSSSTTKSSAKEACNDSASTSAVQVATPEGKDDVAVLQQELFDVEKTYAGVWRAIRDASPVYAQLMASRDSLCELSRVQKELLPPDMLMLFFHLGSRSSAVWIIDGSGKPVEVIPLQVTQTLPALQFQQPTNRREAAEINMDAKRSAFVGIDGESTEGRRTRKSLDDSLTALATDSTAELSENEETRGIVGRLSVDKGFLRRGLEPIPPGPLTREIAARLVTWYLAATVPMFPNNARGLSGTVATIKGQPITPSALTIVADTLLPTAVREAVARRRPKAIVIVPDGALHQLPFEALLLTAGPDAKYVLDEWPALTYVPSATVLARLTDRVPIDAASELRLLLVGHSGKKEEKRVGVVREGTTRAGTRFNAAPLPGVSSECQRIESLWPKHVTTLLDDDATESRVTGQMSSHRFLHLATHGFVDERADNLFGGLLLSADANGRDDGYLSYLDILRSDLTGCELAVLSACQTSIGPERPMEASTSLAQAFLAAGSRQVVASLWQVSDESTSELMADFYRRLAEDVSANRPLRVAAALHDAKQQLRKQAAWNSPAHWASFIFVGPAK